MTGKRERENNSVTFNVSTAGLWEMLLLKIGIRRIQLIVLQYSILNASQHLVTILFLNMRCSNIFKKWKLR